MKTRVFLVLISTLLMACSSSRKISLVNLAGTYNNWNFTTLASTAYVNQEGETEVFIEFNLNDFIYKQENEASPYRAFYSIHYDLFEGYEDKKSLDSATFYYYDSLYYGFDRAKLHRLLLALPAEGDHVLQIIVKDIYGAQALEHYIELDAGKGLGENDFILFDQDTLPLLSSVLESKQAFIIQVNDPDLEKLYVRHYDRDFPIAYPPFWNEQPANYDYAPDSFFVIPMNEGISNALSFPQLGIYQFQADTNIRTGKSIMRFYDGFPGVADPQRLLEPLRYITTEDEYNELKAAPDLKLAVDRFWLDNAGNPGRARNMIKKYYTRVADANRLFTSYLEGWKTDRGLIYIIFGPPKIVYRANYFEEWIYGEAGNSSSIKFQFFQVDNPFTNNDFSLYRMPNYKERWYSVVSSWRR